MINAHVLYYPSPNNINPNYMYTIGFLLSLSILIQSITGILLTLHFTSDIILAFYSVLSIVQDLYYGWYIRYLHTNGWSMVMLLNYFHISRGLYVNSYMYNNNLWLSGNILNLLLASIAFMGYLLIWGQMSFWGGTVIFNLLILIPNIYNILSGSFYLTNPTLHRWFIFHSILPFISIGFIIIHVYYLHYIWSTNTLGYKLNNIITFYPNILYTDLTILNILLGLGYTFQLFISIFNLWHPDNNIEVNGLITPQHIVPEWYFLHFYCTLKVIPHNNLGLICFITSILICIILGELSNISTIWRIFNYVWINGHLFITYYLILIWMCLWIGSQIPHELIICYGRIYYFVNNYVLYITLYWIW